MPARHSPAKRAIVATAAVAAFRPGVARGLDAGAYTSGAGHDPGRLVELIVLVAATLALIWLAALVLGAWQAWSDGSVSAFGLVATILRGCLVVALIGAFIR